MSIARPSLRSALLAALCAVFTHAPLALAQPVLIETPTTVGPLDTEIMASDGTIVPLATAEITVRGTTLTINGRHDIASLVVESGATVTHDAAFEFDYSGIGSDVVPGLTLVASGDIVVEPDGLISVSGRGFAGGEGPGAGSNSDCGFPGASASSGGGYGGDGGDACVQGGVANGDALAPTGFGSGGGSGRGGGGGGTLRLVAGGFLDVRGSILADGANGTGTCCLGGGGGSGGAIWLEASTLLGNGVVFARGGDGNVGSQSRSAAGGGGRIRIDSSLDLFTGSIEASGGVTAAAGGAGTIVLSDDDRAHLIIDNTGITGARTDVSTVLEVDTMYVGGGAVVSAQPLTPLQIRVRHELVVDVDGRIDVSGRGHRAEEGPGGGRDRECGLPGAFAATGGSHGGFGGGTSCASGFGPYGDEKRPMTYGSGGGRSSGGFGGGAAEIAVGGTLLVNGVIWSNGTAGSGYCCGGGGGGAGGSIIVSARSIMGVGSIRADGGAGHSGRFTQSGGGSGGRIAIYTCDLSLMPDSISVRHGSPSGGDGSIVVDTATSDLQSLSLVKSLGSSAALVGRLSGAEVLSRQWTRNGMSLEDGATPWGSMLSGTAAEVLVIEDLHPEDAGFYGLRGEASCGRFEIMMATLDAFCAVMKSQEAAGFDDRFRGPSESTSASVSLLDALRNRRPGRPFHEFDQIPAVTPGVDPDSRLAHTFEGLPINIVAARLRLRVRAGGTGSASPVAEGTDAIRLGFATGFGPDAMLNTVWERRMGGTELDPDMGLLAGELWRSGDEALIELDLAALPISAPLGEPGAATTSLIDELNTNGYLDVTVVDETGVDFMLLEIETSDGTVFPWAVGPEDASACEGERAEFNATTGGVGGPFTYQWRRDGVAIDSGVNPSAAEATLVLDPVTLDDYASYDCVVRGDNTCGEATTTSAMLNDFGCCTADFDADGVLTVFDFLAFQNAFDAMDPQADLDGDGEFTLFDFLAFQTAFDAGCA